LPASPWDWGSRGPRSCRGRCGTSPSGPGPARGPQRTGLAVQAFPGFTRGVFALSSRAPLGPRPAPDGGPRGLSASLPAGARPGGRAHRVSPWSFSSNAPAVRLEPARAAREQAPAQPSSAGTSFTPTHSMPACRRTLLAAWGHLPPCWGIRRLWRRLPLPGGWFEPFVWAAPRRAAQYAGHFNCWPQSLTFQQLQVLFHSLFRVLFIFPLRYFSFIGLLRVFSLGWVIPPVSGCTIKQPYSMRAAPLWVRGIAHSRGHLTGL